MPNLWLVITRPLPYTYHLGDWLAVRLVLAFNDDDDDIDNGGQLTVLVDDP